MFPDIVGVKYLDGYRVHLAFADGVEGTLDLAASIVGKGGVFKPLEKIEFFSQVKVNPELDTIAWPNDVDLDPEVLYAEITGQPVPFAEPEHDPARR